jgi:hypothetical protein
MLAFGEISDKELKYLEKSVQIAGTRDYTKKNEDRKKIEIFQVNTFQNQDDMFPYRIRIAVELKDREENVYVASFTGEPSGDYDSEYEGEDYWELYMPYEDLEGLKVTAYAVQYGVMDGDQFVILAEEEKNYEKLLKGLNDRTTLVFPNSIALMHYYMYEDSSEGSTESTPRKVKAVK